MYFQKLGYIFIFSIAPEHVDCYQIIKSWPETDVGDIQLFYSVNKLNLSLVAMETARSSNLGISNHKNETSNDKCWNYELYHHWYGTKMCNMTECKYVTCSVSV